MPVLPTSFSHGGVDARISPEQALDRFGQDALLRITEVLNDVADQIVERARLLAPVRTGTLRDSIHKEEIDVTHYDIVADANYAIYVELGTHKMRAQPFLTPAVESFKATLTNRLVNTLREALQYGRV